MTARRYRFEQLLSDGRGGSCYLLRDKRGRVREFGDIRRAVTALTAAGHDPDNWRVWWRDETRIYWVAVPGSARDAFYVLTGEVLR